MKKKNLAILTVLAAVIVAAVCIFAGVKRHGAAFGAVPAAAGTQDASVSDTAEAEEESPVSKESGQNVPQESSPAEKPAEATEDVPAEQTGGDDQTDTQEITGDSSSSEEEQEAPAYDPAYTPGENESEEVPFFG